MLTKSDSEAFLKSLADRTFLKLWTLPNTFYAPGKELSDLIIPFGDDIIIISDKASRFAFEGPPELAWRRWYARTVGGGVRQLKTAMQRVRRDPDSVFADGRASIPIPHILEPIGSKRFHLVAIARSSPDPTAVAPQWPGLTYRSSATEHPFEIGPLEIAGIPVHVFDGPTIDLLLEQLDTAPDFIAYLKGRSKRLGEPGRYRFLEKDLLAASLIGWDEEPPGLPSVPPLATVVPGLWNLYVSGETAERRRVLDHPGRVIDNIIAQHHDEVDAGRSLYVKPSFAQHEQALRLLAAESRFARRIIAYELYDILNEPDQSTYWVTTVASPTMPSLRYVWLTHSDRPDNVPTELADAAWHNVLTDHVLVAQALFPETLVMGIAMPNLEARDMLIIMALHDGSSWTDADREEALKLQDAGIFAQLHACHRVHVR